MVGHPASPTDSSLQYECINPNPCGLVAQPDRSPDDRQRHVREQMPTALIEAFAALRNHQLITDEGTSGCCTCGGSRLAKYATDLIDAGYTVKGTVMFSNQATFYAPALQYGPIHTDAHGKVGLETEPVGELVCSVLDDVDADYSWSGDGDDTIQIHDTWDTRWG